MEIVDAEDPPLRVFFGDAPLQIAEADYASRLETWRAWQHVAHLARKLGRAALRPLHLPSPGLLPRLRAPESRPAEGLNFHQ